MPTTHTTITLTFGTDATGRPTMMTPQGGLISYNRNFKTHLEAMRTLPVEMQLLQTSGYMLPGGAAAVWFPNMLASGTNEWTNRLLANDTIIEEKEPPKKSGQNSGNPILWQNALRITFAKVSSQGYRFVGVFKEDQTANQSGIHVYKRVTNLASIAVDTAVTTI